MNKINHRQIQDLIQLGFDTTNTTDDATVAGRLSWNTDDSTLDLGMGNDVSLQIGHELFFDAINQTGATIADGTPVMFAGTLGASGKALIQEAIADGSLLPEYIMGIVTHDIADGVSGKVTWFGKVRGIDTSGTPYGETWADGDLIWVSQTTAGELTNVEPTSGQKILVAAVIKAHASTGTLLVRPSWDDYSNHNDLNGLQGGISAEYYHLTSAQHTDLTDGGETTLHTHAASGITSGTMATARLGSGTASASTVLHGDQTYKKIKFFLPFSTYAHVNPITASNSSPFGVTIDRDCTFVTWSQHVYVQTTNDGSNYWTIELRRINGASTINTITTASISPNTQTVITDTSFSANGVASDKGYYIVCTKTGSPGSLYMVCPIVEVEF